LVPVFQRGGRCPGFATAFDVSYPTYGSYLHEFTEFLHVGIESAKMLQNSVISKKTKNLDELEKSIAGDSVCRI
jgi:hypothetical protein